MKAKSINQRHELWKLAFAHASFRNAGIFLEQLSLPAFSENYPIRNALSIAFLTSYSRPFKQKTPVKLSDEIVPARFRKSHDAIITYRDKTIAHRDLNGPVADRRPVNQVRFKIVGNTFSPVTGSPVISAAWAAELIPLIDHLIQSLDSQWGNFKQHFKPFLFNDGEYELDLDESTPWFKKV